MFWCELSNFILKECELFELYMLQLNARKWDKKTSIEKLETRCLFFRPLGALKTNITTKDIWVWYTSLMDDLRPFAS